MQSICYVVKSPTAHSMTFRAPREPFHAADASFADHGNGAGNRWHPAR